MNTTTLPIIFRRQRTGDFKGEVTAVFPTLAWDYFGRELTAWDAVGGHCGASFEWYFSTAAAAPDEYSAMLAQLRTIYAPAQLRICKRMSSLHRREYARDAKRALQTLRDNPSGRPWVPMQGEVA